MKIGWPRYDATLCPSCNLYSHLQLEASHFSELIYITVRRLCCLLLRPNAHWVHTTWIDKVSSSLLPHLITDPSLAHRGIHVTPQIESMRFVRHSCRFMSCGLSVHSALLLYLHISTQGMKIEAAFNNRCKLKFGRVVYFRQY